MDIKNLKVGDVVLTYKGAIIVIDSIYSRDGDEFVNIKGNGFGSIEGTNVSELRDVLLTEPMVDYIFKNNGLEKERFCTNMYSNGTMTSVQVRDPFDFSVRPVNYITTLREFKSELERIIGTGIQFDLKKIETYLSNFDKPLFNNRTTCGNPGSYSQLYGF